MSKKVTVISLLVVVALFVLVITVYKFSVYEPTQDSYYFKWTKLDKTRNDLKLSEKLDKDTYKDKIITENLLSIDYSLFHEKESITGEIYIGSDKHLYITDSNKDLVHRVSTIKFRTMYSKDYEYTDGIYIYLISEDNKLYYLSLENNDITKTKIVRPEITFKVTNFVNLDFINDIYTASNTLLVLSENGNIYDVASSIRYQEEIKSLYNNLYVFKDNVMTDVFGRVLTDSEGNYYKVKYSFLTYENNNFSGDNTIIIITEDNKLLYVEPEPDYVYEFDKKVENIKFGSKYPYIKDKLELTFEDDYKIEIEASCNLFYCINEFAE